MAAIAGQTKLFNYDGKYDKLINIIFIEAMVITYCPESSYLMNCKNCLSLLVPLIMPLRMMQVETGWNVTRNWNARFPNSPTAVDFSGDGSQKPLGSETPCIDPTKLIRLQAIERLKNQSEVQIDP